MVPGQRPKRVDYISNCLPLDSKPTRLYKTENPTYLRRTTPRRFYLYKIGSHVLIAALYKSRHRLLPPLQICHVGNVNSAPIRPAHSLSSALSNLLPTAATNHQWHKERIASVGMYGQRLRGHVSPITPTRSLLATSVRTSIAIFVITSVTTQICEQHL